MAGKEERLNNVPDGTLLNRLFCVEAPQNSDDRRGEITCVISPRGLSVRFGKEEGMKKQKLHFGILLVVCMLCAAAWFLVRYLDLPESEEEEAVEVTVTDFKAEDVTALSTGGEYPLNFVKEEGTWYNAEDRSASIQQSMVENLLTYITHITSETAIEEPDDLSQYGLDECGSESIYQGVSESDPYRWVCHHLPVIVKTDIRVILGVSIPIRERDVYT